MSIIFGLLAVATAVSTRLASLIGLVIAVVVVVAIAARANELSAAKATEALRLCDEASRASWMNKSAAIMPLDNVIVVAEAAVAADDSDAHAHLALFCGLARQLEIAGLSWRSFSRLQRVHHEIDRASALAPNDPEVLVARGGFLCRTLRPLGGDPTLGEQLLRHALELKPNHVVGRLYLARALAARYAPDARAQAYKALALAKNAGAIQEEIEAQELLASIQN